jgi:hypothetical protein
MKKATITSGREPDHLAGLFEQWPCRREARPRKPPGLEQVIGRERPATGRKASLRERAEDDVG